MSYRIPSIRMKGLSKLLNFLGGIDYYPKPIDFYNSAATSGLIYYDQVCWRNKIVKINHMKQYCGKRLTGAGYNREVDRKGDQTKFFVSWSKCHHIGFGGDIAR